MYVILMYVILMNLLISFVKGEHGWMQEVAFICRLMAQLGNWARMKVVLKVKPGRCCRIRPMHVSDLPHAGRARGVR